MLIAISSMSRFGLVFRHVFRRVVDIIDVQNIVMGRDDASGDCIHYYEEDSIVGGTVMRMVVQALLNMIC